MDTNRNGARTWGYARVSSNSQNLQRQLDSLLAYGIGERELVCDKASGKDFQREGYIALKSQMLRTVSGKIKLPI